MVRLVPKSTRRVNLTVGEVGGKGLGLIGLSRMEGELKQMSSNYSFPEGIVVPKFFIIPDGYDLSHFDTVKRYAERLGSDEFAVRSSSPLEDNVEHPFDGIFNTNLNVRINDLREAVEDVRGSALAEKARRHAEELGLQADERMAVIIQQMINNAYSGVAYSKFPSSQDIAKVITTHEDEYEVSVFSRKAYENGYLDIERRLIDGALTLSRLGDYKRDAISSGSSTFDSTEERKIAELSLSVEQKFGYPVRMEYLVHGMHSIDGTLYIVQARPVAGLDKLATEVQLPEIEEGLVFGTTIVNGSGDFTLPAVNIAERENPLYDEDHHGLSYDIVKQLDAQYSEGYVLVCELLQFGPGFSVPYTNYDEITPHKKAVVAVSDLGQHHDLDIARENDLLYLGTGLVDMRVKHNRGIPHMVKTGDMVRVVSDGIAGFLYNTQLTK
jgi:hypothetical protein